MAPAVSPSATTKSRCRGSSLGACVSLSPRSERTMSATKGTLRALGLSAAQLITASANSGRRTVRRAVSTSAASTTTKTRNRIRPKRLPVLPFRIGLPRPFQPLVGGPAEGATTGSLGRPMSSASNGCAWSRRRGRPPPRSVTVPNPRVAPARQPAPARSRGLSRGLSRQHFPWRSRGPSR